MRRAARVDSNQVHIVKAFRDLGCSVAITSSLGDGFPDAVVGLMGQNVLVEIKDGAKPPSARKLTPDEAKFASSWRGEYKVIESIEDATNLVADMRSRVIA